MDMNKFEKRFPAYFANFTMPEGARDQRIKVLRACRTCCVEKESFLPTYEENVCCVLESQEPDDPGVYSLSTYEKPRDVKRFVATNYQYKPPFKIAIGVTEPVCGPSQRTKERKPQQKNSHVDWWLYENAEPYNHFELIDNFNEFYSEYKKEKGIIK